MSEHIKHINTTILREQRAHLRQLKRAGKSLTKEAHQKELTRTRWTVLHRYMSSTWIPWINEPAVRNYFSAQKVRALNSVLRNILKRRAEQRLALA